jgi:hypothetical protein
MLNKKRFFVISAMALLGAITIVGCNSGPEMTESQRQDQILNDPMNYKPDIGRDVGDPGDFGHGGFNSDMKNTFGQ